MKELAGRTAVVTGAGSGIGRALACRFATEGMQVGLLDIDGDAARATAELIADVAPATRTFTVAVDVSDDDAVARAADAVFAEFGAVHVLCLNAGVFLGGLLWERPKVDLDFAFGVNIDGVINGIRRFVPRMIAQDTEGHVVTTASVAGLFGTPFAGPYSVSKFAAFAVGETLAHDLIATGTKLRASVLCPGIIKTPIAHTARDRGPQPGTDTSDEQRFINDVLVDIVDEGGLDPSVVGDRVVSAIRDERFLTLTHDHHAESIAARAHELAELQLPTIVDYS